MIPLEHITALLQNYGYLILAPIAVLEGPIISVIGGILVALGTLHLYTVFIVLVLGDLAGDVIHYAIGRFGQRRFSRFLKKRFNIGEDKMTRLRDSFIKHDAKILLITKTQAIGSVVLLLGGVLRMPFWRFVWWNIVGTVPKVALLMCVGYFFGHSLSQVETYLKYTGILTFALALIAIGLYWRFSVYLKKNLDKELSV